VGEAAAVRTRVARVAVGLGEALGVGLAVGDAAGVNVGVGVGVGVAVATWFGAGGQTFTTTYKSVMAKRIR
jgi:hypothetical protein